MMKANKKNQIKSVNNAKAKNCRNKSTIYKN